MGRTAGFVTAALVGVALHGAAVGLSAQDLSYRSISRPKLAGPMAMAARLGGMPQEVEEVVYIKGDRMRTDSKDASTILDLSAGRFIQLDHRKKTYTSVSLDSLEAYMRAAAKDAKSEDAPDVKFTLEVTPTGERQRIGDYEAERVYMTLELEAQAEEGSGRVVYFSDLWLSKDAPGYEASQRFAEAMGERAGGIEALMAAFAQTPEATQAMKNANREMRKLAGMPVRSTAYMVMLPEGVKFDRKVLLEEEAKAEAKPAQKPSIGGLLGGALRGKVPGGQQPQQAEPAEAGMTTLFSVATEIRDLSTASVDASRFEIPAGYKEKPWQD